MMQTVPRQDSLVLYKTQPARVRRAGKKLEIELQNGDVRSVRPKDVVLLHPGPVADLRALQAPPGEVETAWELLAGETTTLAELAELAFDAYTPATAWAAWQLVVDGLYFRGTPKEVTAVTQEEVARQAEARQARAEEERTRAAFLARVRARGTMPEDAAHLRDVEELAWGRANRSSVLRDLGRTESPESAHALLLDLGHWDRSVDPYPHRLKLATKPVAASLRQLPDEERLDLTHLPAFAIDDEGNQEPDDALSLEGSRLWVHIADVAALVPPESPADLEARARGASLYLPEGTVDMLPAQAIETLGLGLAEVSPALSFGLDLSAGGETEGIEIVPSWVRVTRLTYAQADEQLGGESLKGLYQLAQRNQERRRERGAVLIQLPEVKIWVEQEQVFVRPIPPLRSRDLVTEAMVMAGEAVAAYALRESIPIPFTTQDPPGSEERPQDLAGMYALRRTLRPSHPSSAPGPHAGLGLGVYAQCTSPLRRYLDLVIHQQLRAHLRGEDLLQEQEVLERIGAAAAVSGSVRQGERLARRHWTLVYLEQNPDWCGEGILVEKRGLRATALIPDLDLDARLHLRQDLPLNSPVQLTVSKTRLAELAAHFQVAG